MECLQHEGKEATGACVECRAPVCDDCRFELNGKLYCRKCATAFIEDIDTKLKLEIPTEVTCAVCGRTETTGLEPFYVCSRCGEVVCEGHWYGEESYCEECYDLDTEFKVDESRAEGLTRPCPSCGTDNLLDASRCRSRECGSILTPLIDAEEIRKKNIPCGNHADRLAYVQCVGCGKYLCLECENAYKEENYCDECEAKEKQKEAIRLKKETKTLVTVLGIVGGVILLCIIASLVFGCISDRGEKENEYDLAITCYEEGRYEEAIEKLSSLGGFKDSEEKIAEVKTKAYEKEYALGKDAEKNGELEGALGYYETADKYKPGEVKEDIYRINIIIANYYFEEKRYEEAVTYFDKVRIVKALPDEDFHRYNQALALINVEKGDREIKRADEKSKGFNYNKAIKDWDEYGKLVEAVSATEAAVAYYEKAENINSGLKGLKGKLEVARRKKVSRHNTLSRLNRDRGVGKKKGTELGSAADRLAFANEIRSGNGSVTVYGPENKYIKIYGDVFDEYEGKVIARPPQHFLNDFRKRGFEKVTMVGPNYSRTYNL